MPDSIKVHLPSSMTRSDVYDRMDFELREMDIQPCSKTVFFKMWRKQYPDIVIPRVRSSSCNLVYVWCSKLILQIVCLFCIWLHTGHKKASLIISHVNFKALLVFYWIFLRWFTTRNRCKKKQIQMICFYAKTKSIHLLGQVCEKFRTWIADMQALKIS